MIRSSQNPILRRTMARAVSLHTAARQHNLDEQALVDELNSAAGLARDVDDSRQQRQEHQNEQNPSLRVGIT